MRVERLLRRTEAARTLHDVTAHALHLTRVELGLGLGLGQGLGLGLGL